MLASLVPHSLPSFVLCGTCPNIVTASYSRDQGMGLDSEKSFKPTLILQGNQFSWWAMRFISCLFVCCRWLFSWYGEGVLRLKHCWAAMQVRFVACTCEESVLTCLLYWDMAGRSILASKLLRGEGLETRLSRWKEDYSTDRLHFPLPSPLVPHILSSLPSRLLLLPPPFFFLSDTRAQCY